MHAREKAKSSKMKKCKGDVDASEPGSDLEGQSSGEDNGTEQQASMSDSEDEKDSDIDEDEVWKVRVTLQFTPHLHA